MLTLQHLASAPINTSLIFSSVNTQFTPGSGAGFGFLKMPKYDISTLLALRHQAHFDVGRLAVQALNSNLLRQHRPPMRTLVEEPVNRRKPSSFSHQSEDILAGGLQPLRPPNDPPHSTLAQTNSGFAQFLKEHTSPKHQRVTAGGRIVPMEPQTPVPKFRLTLRKRTDGDCDEGDDLKIVTRDDDRGSKLESEDTQTVEVGPGPAGSTPSRSVRLLPNLARSSLVQGSETYTNAFGMPGLFPPAATNTGAFLQQNAVLFSYNTSQLPFNADGPLPPYYSACGAGIDAGSCFPACYPPMPAQEFITAGQTRIQQPTSVPRFSEGAASGSISAGSASSCGQFSSGFDTRACLGPQWQWQAGGPLPAFSQPHVHPAAYRENPYQSRLKEVRGQYDILSAQLSRIDRHMALNAWDIDGQSKTLLVEQRKSLVRELDVLRLYIEQLEQSLDMTKWGICDSTASAAVGTPTPMGNPYTHLVGPRTLVPNLIYGMQSIPAPPFPNTFPEFFPSIDSTGGTFPVQNADNSAYYSSDAQEETAAANRHNQRPRPQQSLSVNIPHGPVETGLQASTGEDATESAAPDDNRWATPARSSPLELQQIYHRIEEANKRGEKLDGLLRELSSATSELLRRRQEESRRPCQPISGQGTMVYPSMVAAGATRGASDNIESNLHLMRHGRRPWASEFYPREHSSTHKCMPRKDAEADGNMSSSCVSTTDSWATLHETDIRQPGSEALRSGSKGVDDSGSWERPRESSFASIASIKSPRVQLPSTASWQGPLADNSPSRPSVHHPVYDVSKGSDGDGSKPVYSLFLPQPFQKGHSHVSQKTPALAVSQRVNAHACLDSKTATHGAFQSWKKPQGKRLWYRP